MEHLSFLKKIATVMLDLWNVGGTQGGRRSKERERDGQDHGTKTLASQSVKRQN